MNKHFKHTQHMILVGQILDCKLWIILFVTFRLGIGKYVHVNTIQIYKMPQQFLFSTNLVLNLKAIYISEGNLASG